MKKNKENKEHSKDHSDEKKEVSEKSKSKTSWSWLYWLIAILAVAGIIWYVNSMGADDEVPVNDNDLPAPVPEPVNSTSESDVMVTVNGEEIKSDYIDDLYNRLPPQMRFVVTKEDLLNTTINEVLLLQNAKELGIDMNDAELDSYIDYTLKQEGFSREDFEKEAQAKGLDLEEMKELFRRKGIIDKLIKEKIVTDFTLGESDLQNFYDENPEQFKTPETLRAAHILVKTKEEADDVIKRIEEGEDFSALAINLSVDKVSGARGGDLGFFSRGMMVKEFEDAAFNLEVDELSAPVESQFGWHIIYLMEKNPIKTIPYSEIKDKINESLTADKIAPAVGNYLANLRSKATITQGS